jgi:hypothetical protein
MTIHHSTHQPPLSARLRLHHLINTAEHYSAHPTSPTVFVFFFFWTNAGNGVSHHWPPNREVQAHDTHRTAPEPPPRIQQSALDRQTRPETQSGRSMERAKEITYEHSKVPHIYIPTPAPASLIRAGTVTPLLVAHGSHN